MKRIIAILLLLIALTTGATAEGLYIRFGNVVDIEYDVGVVSIDDGMGNIWEYYGTYDVEYFFVADLVVMFMDDNGTADYIYDDRIVNVYPVSIDEAEELIRMVKAK